MTAGCCGFLPIANVGGYERNAAFATAAFAGLPSRSWLALIQASQRRLVPKGDSNAPVLLPPALKLVDLLCGSG
jgi:hypothetical protein